MSPRWPRRRARRRSPAGPIMVFGALAVLVALLIGGLTQVSRQSQGYDAASNRSLAALGRVVAEQSNATSSSLTALMGVLQQQNRVGLQITLDNLVQQSADQAARAGATTHASPFAADFAKVFADRAQAMTTLRAAIDGYLGMQPLPVSGTTTTTTGVSGANSTLLTAAQATNRIAAVGTLLTHSDALYRTLRRDLAAAVGHARLPKSAWVSNAQQWGLGTVATQVDLMATTPSLAVVHYLALRTVQIGPPALPTPQGASASVAVITPTTQLTVDVVLGNNGSVEEPHATVHYTLADQTTGATSSQVETAALAANASQVLPTVSLPVKPGTTYVLTVSVDLPAGQTQTIGTAFQQVVQVAPAT